MLMRWGDGQFGESPISFMRAVEVKASLRYSSTEQSISAEMQGRGVLRGGAESLCYPLQKGGGEGKGAER